jgi:uncharacterized protein
MKRTAISAALLAILIIAVTVAMVVGLRPGATTRTDVMLVRSDEALLDAIEQSNAEALRAIVAADPAIPRKWRSGGQTALHLVARHGDAVGVRMLLDAGAEVDARVSDGWAGQGMTPLMYAAATGNLAAAQELLAAGADVDAKSEYGKTAAQIAEINEHPETAQYLRNAIREKAESKGSIKP